MKQTKSAVNKSERQTGKTHLETEFLKQMYFQMGFETEEIVTSEYKSKRQNTDNQNYMYSEDDSKVTESSDIISQ